ncbi:RNA-directed DNA polymerase, eukaryota [Tanacetum coccineum]
MRSGGRRCNWVKISQTITSKEDMTVRLYVISLDKDVLSLELDLSCKGFLTDGNATSLWHIAKAILKLEIGCLHLHANVVRFQSDPKPSVWKPKGTYQGTRHVGVNVANSGDSYASILKICNPSYASSKDSCPAMVLDDACNSDRDLSMSLTGKVKDINTLPNLYLTIEEEGFQNVKLSYLRGLWVLIDLISCASKEKFCKNVGVCSWFKVLKHACDSFVYDIRIVWLSIEGLPLKVWTQNTFVKIASKWGELVDMKDCRDLEAWVPDFHDKSLSSDDESLGEDEGQSSDIKNQENGNMNKHSEEEVQSEDPFNIYDLLQKNKENVGQSLEEDPQFPPGFTPVANDAEKGDTQCVDNFNEHLSTNSGNKNNSGNSKEVMDELVKIGQTMGYNMEGCMKNIEVIIGSQGDALQETKIESIELFSINALWGNFSFDHAISSSIGTCIPTSTKLLVISVYAPQELTEQHKHLSDHRPILMRELNVDYGATPFRVFHSWFNREGFDKLVKNSWKNSNFEIFFGCQTVNPKKLSDVDKVLDQGGYSEDTVNYRASLLKELQDINSIEALDIAQKAKCFFMASGLRINIHKSKLMGIGVHLEEVDRTARIVGCSTFSSPFQYLGVKAGGVMSKTSSWDEVNSKVYSRLSKWKLNSLFIGGRLTSSPWLDILREVSFIKSKGIDLYALIRKKVVAAKLRYDSLASSFRRPPRGGAEETQFGLLNSCFADLILSQMSGEFLVKSTQLLKHNVFWGFDDVVLDMLGDVWVWLELAGDSMEQVERVKLQSPFIVSYRNRTYRIIATEFAYWAPNIESMEVNSESNPLERKDAEGPSLDESLEMRSIRMSIDSCSAKDLFLHCKQYGHVVDSFIPNKRSKSGKRFGFVKFINVFNEERLVNNLCTVWIGRFKLMANLARFKRENKTGRGKEGRTENGENIRHKFCTSSNAGSFGNGKSFVSVVKKINKESETEFVPSIVLDDECLNKKDLSILATWENFGYYWNLKNAGAGSWFSVLHLANDECVPDGRLAWVEVGGVPFKLWTVKTFSRIASKWGDLMDVDEDELNYHSKRLCVFTKVRQNIQESFKVNFRGKVHWVRAIEVPGWIPEFNDEEEEDDVSDECNFDGKPESGSILNFMEEVVKVGQTMGYNMEGCIKDINDIIESQGEFGETKMGTMDLNTVRSCWGNSIFEYVQSDSVGYSGGILCIWDPNSFRRNSFTRSDYFVIIRGVWLKSGIDLLIVVVYAPQDAKEKHMLWEYLTHISNSWDGKIVMMGDFNEFVIEELRLCDELIDKGMGSSEVVQNRLGILNKIHQVQKNQASEISQKAKIKWAIEGERTLIFLPHILNLKRSQLRFEVFMANGVVLDRLGGRFLSTGVHEGISILSEVLKQGDPLSPFLFILVMESLHISFQRVVDAGLFNGINLSSTVNLSHLFYADDAIFIGQWNELNIDTLVRVVLDVFYGLLSSY